MSIISFYSLILYLYRNIRYLPLTLSSKMAMNFAMAHSKKIAIKPDKKHRLHHLLLLLTTAPPIEQ